MPIDPSLIPGSDAYDAAYNAMYPSPKPTVNPTVALAGGTPALSRGHSLAQAVNPGVRSRVGAPLGQGGTPIPSGTSTPRVGGGGIGTPIAGGGGIARPRRGISRPRRRRSGL